MSCNRSGLKPLCQTRWTVRAEAIDAVIKPYTIIIGTLDEVHSITKDEYRLKAGGIVTALENVFWSTTWPSPLWNCGEYCIGQ